MSSQFSQAGIDIEFPLCGRACEVEKLTCGGSLIVRFSEMTYRVRTPSGRGMPLSLVDLLPTVRSLSRQDKLRLIQLLAVDLAQTEETGTLQSGQSYPRWSPDRAYDAAAVLLQALDAERGQSA